MNSYTYEKLHVWKVTRIEYWVLIGALLYAYRFFHGTFDTRMFSNVKLFIRGTFGAFCPLRPTILLILHVIKATRIKSYTYENIHVWNGEFWLVLKHTRMKSFTYILIRVSFYTRNFWYAYHFIHETFDTRIVLYTKLLIRVCFLTWNFSYVEPLALFVHFGQP